MKIKIICTNYPMEHVARCQMRILGENYGFGRGICPNAMPGSRKNLILNPMVCHGKWKTQLRLSFFRRMMYDVGEQLWSVRETGCFRRTLSVLLLGDPPDRTGTKTLGKLAYTALEALP